MNQLDIKAYLRKLSTQGKLYYIPNKGNAGDALLALGTIMLFDELGIDYEICSPEPFDAQEKHIPYI
jgi:hypothetical protein